MENTGEETSLLLDVLSLYGDLEGDVPEHLGLWSELRRKVQAADGDPRGAEVPHVNEAVSCVVRRGQGQRLGHRGLLPAQDHAQVGQCLPSGWPVAWGQGPGTSTWARGGRLSDLSSTEGGAK